MAANKTIEILQLQIDRLNQEQTENKWNERDKKLFEKFLGLVHDDPFRIFYADGEEVHRILELVYPETVKEKIEELFRIKYIYDGFLKYGEVVKPQIEVERPNLEILIKDISDHYLEVYRKRKKEKENALKRSRLVLEKVNKQHYITMEDCSLLLELMDDYEKTMEEKVLVLAEILENNNLAMQELLKLKTSKKGHKESVKPKVEKTEEQVVVEPVKVDEQIEVEDTPVVPIIPMIEPDITSDFVEPVLEPTEEKEIPSVIEKEEEPEVSFEEAKEEPIVETQEKLENAEEQTIEGTNENQIPKVEEPGMVEESYIEQYVKALEGIDMTDLPAIHSVLPKYHMPNFKEIMDLLRETVQVQIDQIKEEEQQSDGKRVRVLRDELSKAQQLLKILNTYAEKQGKSENTLNEKIVDGEEIQLLLLENDEGDSLIERDFKKQLSSEQYGIAMELLRCLEQFSDPQVRAKAVATTIPGIQELSNAGVHIFFEPFAENTYIVIALLAEKNGYASWIEDKLRLRHGLFQKQAKGMQRRWNQHGTRNTMLLGSETAYLEMQDMAEKR